MDTSTAGYVYVLQMEGLPYFKIGRTSDLSRRIGQIKPQMPGKLIVVIARKVPDMFRVERCFHEDFSDRRMNGEWFKLDEACLSEICHALNYVQSDYTTWRLRQSLQLKDLSMERVAKIARVLSLSAPRCQRRLSSYSDLNFIRKPTDMILEAEVIG